MTHVVWNERTSGSNAIDVLHYCRIPQGASACGDQQTFAPFNADGNYDVAGPQVMVTPFGDVILLTNRVGLVNGQFAANQVYYSSNNGAPGSFSGPTAVSSNSPSGRPAVFDSGEGLLVTVSASRTGGTFVQGAPIEGPYSTAEAQLSSGDKAYDGTVIQRGPGSYAAAYADFQNVYVRTFQCSGAGCARQKLNDPANWTAEVTVPEAQEPRLASGPNGTFLMYRTHPAGGGSTQWMVRPVVGAGVGAPTPISALGAGGVHRDLFEDATGVLHAVFKDENAALTYRSSPNGTGWSAPTTLQPGPDFAVSLPRVAATNGAGGLTGFAVWAEGTGNAPILIARLGPPSGGPPPPPTGPPNNTSPPQILPTATADTYMCFEGAWENLPPDPKYEYFWFYSPDGAPGASYDLVGNQRTFTVTPNRAGGSFYCAVRISNDLGTGAAHSAVVVLGTKRFGDFQIRGIDLFQTVQPSSCAQMYSVPPGPWGQDTNFGEQLPSDPFLPPALGGYWFAGGGTPTAYGATRNECVEQGRVGADPQRVRYAGVTMDADKPTTAVVYVSMANKGAGFTNGQHLEVTLSFLISGKRIGSVTQDMTNPPDAKRPFVTTAERDAPGSGGVQFSVPDYVISAARESNDLSVEAKVDFPAAAKAMGSRQCDAPGSCDGNDRFRLDNVPVRGLPALLVEAVALTGRPPATRPNQNFPDPAKVLEKTRQLYPGGDRMYVTDYGAFFDLGFEMNLSLADHECTDFSFKDARTCREYYIGQALVQWSIENGRPAGTAFDILLGVHDYLTDEGKGVFIEPGYTLSDQRAALNGYVPGQGGQPIFTANTGTAKRPLTAAAHEFGHVLSAPHAGQDCDGTRPTDPQAGEPWPPDNRGRLWGAKFDRTAGGDKVTVDKSDGFLSDGFDVGHAALYDLMSYCAPESDAWLSPRNWNRAFEVLREFGQRPGRNPKRAVDAAAAKRAIVVGIIGPDGSGHIVRVTPPDASNAPVAPAPNSFVHLRALNAFGQVIEDSGAHVIHPTSSQEAGGTFFGSVPAQAVAVQLVSDGKVVDTRSRSRAPKLRLLAPRAGAFVRARKKLLVRWSASDPDKDRLQATVEYSPDAGRNWTTVYDGPSTGHASVPGRILAGSKRARVRVRVNDGYDEARAVSGLFRSEGRPPKTTIVRPVTTEKVQAGDRTILVGTALDDRNQPLSGGKLTWYAGRKRLGTGNRRTVRLDAGRIKLRLVARDRNGKQGVATRTIQVAPVMLRITTLGLPASVKHRAKTVKIRIAASGPATLRAGGGLFKVGTRARRLAIRLPRKPASGRLRVPIDLRAGGKVVRGRVRATLTVLRR